MTPLAMSAVFSCVEVPCGKLEKVRTSQNTRGANDTLHKCEYPEPRNVKSISSIGDRLRIMSMKANDNSYSTATRVRDTARIDWRFNNVD